jgi:hypothetical protein
LAIDEFVTLIRLILNEKYQVGKASVIYNIKNGIPLLLLQLSKRDTCYVSFALT